VEPANPWLTELKNEGEDVQMEEDDLLAQDAKKADVQFASPSDCMTKAKACDNCSCGRKEVEDGKVSIEDLEKGNVKSECGKCYLGDAFRCASCPFAGKPAFEPGDKIKLNNTN
jgi:hypothetical protein